MCGIFGIITKPETSRTSESFVNLTNTLFDFSQMRGMESSGVAVRVNKNKKIFVLRKSLNGGEFVKKSIYKQLLNNTFNLENQKEGICILGHTRIATNGMVGLDNQPIQKSGALGIHNGIICNIDYLWKNHPELHRKQIIDTELLIDLVKSKVDKSEGKNIGQVLSSAMKEIEGTASFGIFLNNYSSLMLGSNCGSFYYYQGEDFFAFASEEYILNESLKKNGFINEEKESQICQLAPISFGVVNFDKAEFTLLNENITYDIAKEPTDFEIKDISDEVPKAPFMNSQPESYIRSLLEYPEESIDKLRRCSKCILPETHPYIDFDSEGVCNYCRHYLMRPRPDPIGKDALLEIIEPLLKKKGTNSMLLLSGGRDSCYALHVMKEELGLNPVAYSYDWGMLTDLGRRNQARMCGQLGVEHIVISADIKRKREYIRMNVEAWLKKPDLGMVGLFMAGDKEYHYHAQQLFKRTKLPLFNGGSPMEYTYFKYGFSGSKPSLPSRTLMDKFAIVNHYATQTLMNPSYMNASVLDSVKAFIIYFFTKWDKIPIHVLFRYLPWSESVVNDTLIGQYNWELSPDTPTTWRIGDGTTPFYNYIYHTVAGFTENDCFRSNQVLEGIITREQALKMAKAENKPRYESLKWYFDTIGVDMEKAIKAVNNIPKLYPN
jgi:glucosamine--fructose-6-phosphate aminotransferase (isomerizing)